MPKYATNPEPVQRIKTLADLISYLRDELGWPISPDSVSDDLTFDWSADELRMASGQAVTLQGGAVRQLRPFVHGQPWGNTRYGKVVRHYVCPRKPRQSRLDSHLPAH